MSGGAILCKPVVPAEKWYATRAVGDGVTLIEEPFIKAYYRCNVWHVRGRDGDALIDSGMGVVPLRAHVRSVCERPLLAVASHSHFDHIGGHHEFERRAAHGAEAEILAHPTRTATLAADFATDEMFDAFPPGWNAAEYRIEPAPVTRLLADGDVVDLGDRRLEVIHAPGHSPGSIALWEAASGVLFAGDAVYDGPLSFDLGHSDLAAYVATMKRLEKLPVRVVHGGHFPSFDGRRYREIIGDFLRAHDR
jgi:glyoxylase-like metal-dependent hydrolase (beta-lactamase superfamily II)